MKIWPGKTSEPAAAPPRYPGVVEAMDGSAAVVAMETAASEAAGAYPITPSTQMGEGWAAAVAEGKTNVFGRRLLFFEPEGEHAAAAVTAGMSMTGMRATNFSSGQGIVYMHESLYPAVGKRLTYVLNVAARALTKHALNVHAGHDDYHAVDDTGFFQLFAKDVQESADLNLIAHRIAELSLNPGICAQDGFLTSHVIESIRLPERDLVREFLGSPADFIEAPTPAQRLVFGAKRRRIPEMFDLDHPAMLGVVQNQDSYAQGVAAQRPFYFEHLADLTDRAMAEFATLTGRRYARATGYRTDDAEYLIVGQGSVVANAEAVADFLRETRQLRVGVVNLTMFRPFPADLISRLLRGKKGVVVLERTDQPLAVDLPLLCEIRAALSKGHENFRARGVSVPHPGIQLVAPDDIPDCYSGCFGLGSRDLQPGDVIAAVENMLPAARAQRRRQFYLGIDFIRRDTRLPKLQIWQEQLIDAYPDIEDLALKSAGDFNLLPKNSTSMRIHSVGGWGAITMGKNLSMTAFELFGMHIKANPKYGSEKKGQPTTFYATLAHEPIRLNGELKHVDVVLAPDPNVFRHSDPLDGLADGGVFVLQSELEPAAAWATLPPRARAELRRRGIHTYVIDAFRIAAAEASDADLRYRMQGAAFLGAFFRVSPLLEREGGTEAALFDGIRQQLDKKFGHRGAQVVDDNLRVIRRGYDEVVGVDAVELPDRADENGAVPAIPDVLDVPDAEQGIGNPGRFWEQVCAVCKLSQDVIADPFAAISAIPAATGAVRDMSGVRMEIPDFIAEKCTGCAQCWTQCPDAAIPGLVTGVEDTLGAAIDVAERQRAPLDRLRQLVKPVGKESRRVMAGDPSLDFATALRLAYDTVAGRLVADPERRVAVDAEFEPVHATIAEMRFARTRPFYDLPESKAKGSGGLLSITVNPEACKGCNLCVAVCPDQALVTVRQDDGKLARLRRNWEFWKQLPDTDDRYVNVSRIDEGIGVLPSLLLKKNTYRSMVGGDGACMGCGEKTTVHLVTSTIHALMGPRVERYVARLDSLIATLDAKARELLASSADLRAAGQAPAGEVTVPIDEDRRKRVALFARAIDELKDLRWRYMEGPAGKGRARLGMANSTGCSSVWGSTYPYNPYPFPWVNHLFQDAPSVAIGVFEGQMRKMADQFVSVRRAELLANDAYDAATHEEEFVAVGWQQFTDEEFDMCPPIVTMGGDGAMLDIGFQNLSRLLASGKPLRVVVLDTQVYSNTGGQACTSGFTGQVADMSAYGAVQHGKTEVRKELALIAIAHRGVFVHQSSQASASHLMGGILRGLQQRRPAVFNIYTPCPVEHGLADDWGQHAARLALESRAFPFLTYDPDAGRALADCLTLDGNPAVDDPWPSYTLHYTDDAGAPGSMELPLTIADWAATEGRFRKHFREVKHADWNDEMLPFHEYVALAPDERAAKSPFIWATTGDKRLRRLAVSAEMVRLAEERLLFWSQLRQLAGLEVAPAVREQVLSAVESDFERQVQELRSEYETKLADLRASYPPFLARRLAQGLLRSAGGPHSATELLSRFATGVASDVVPDAVSAPAPSAIPSGSALAPEAASGSNGAGVTASHASSEAGPEAAHRADGAVAAAAAVPPAQPLDDDDLVMEAYVESARCTTCNECTNLNGRLFAYNVNKQAYVKDAKAGTFAQLVQAAEKCPVSAIHPGTPLNPKEKDLPKWIERAKPFS
jgi:pyruvate-ferredoxin/flavodoxin oxidoreductase